VTSGGTAGRWRRIEEVVGDALEREPHHRAAFLDVACASDPELRREVESLLAAHESSGALDALAEDVAPLAARLRGPDTAPGTDGRVGRYRVGERVAGGGMGVVYRAVDDQLGRTVALKFLQARFEADDSAAERFRREARTVAALEHPNICTVHEIGETEDGQLFLAMPLYDGETLQKRIARAGDAGLAVDEAVVIAAQIARGLAKAHGAGVVHRDVKPSNVMLTGDGVVKLLDFGIAKLMDATLPPTGAGRLLGTLAYLSPEQARGERVDQRSDLWSLGVVLYEMLAGRRPFQGAAAAVVIAAIRHGTYVPLATYRPDVPPALAAIVDRALARMLDARYQSAQEMERDLLALGLISDAAGRLMAHVVADGRRPVERTRARWRWGAAAGVALAIMAALLWVARPRGAVPATTPATASAAAPEPSIVVLPFVNMTSDAGNDYFSDGITEEIIAQLAAVPTLKVISRTSAMHYKGSSAPLRQIAGELGVAYALEGSVRRDGDRMRIAVQLVNASTEQHLWSRTYDRRAVDVIAVQDSIAREVGRALEVALGALGARGARGGAAPTHEARDPQAYELYLRGRYHWQKRTKDGHEQAVAYFRRAIERDSTYADAYAGLAVVYLTGYAQSIPGFADREAETYANLKWAAERSVALDDESAQAHRALAILRWWQRDWPGAERELLRTLQLNPGDEQAHNWYGALLGLTGRIEDAVRESRRAYERDPFSLTGSGTYVDQLVLARQYDRAIDQVRRTLEIDPGYPFAQRMLGILYALTGRYPEAVSQLRGVADAAPHIPDFRADLAYAVALAGRREEARRILRDVESLPDGPRKRGAAFSIGRAYVALGDLDSAFAWLDRADWRWPHRGNRYDPALDPVRADPRFVRLSERVDREMGMR
jgi:TolB-like protein/Flp pilus assembly protein TadD